MTLARPSARTSATFGIDVLYARNLTGLGSHVRGLVTALVEDFPGEEWNLVGDPFSLPHFGRIESGNWIGVIGGALGSGFPPPIPLRQYWRRQVGSYLKRRKHDLFHAPVYWLPVGEGLPPLVATIHDVLFRERPLDYRPDLRAFYEQVTADTCQRAAAIICPSHDTRQSLMRHFSVAEDRTFVVPNGVSPGFKPVPVEQIAAIRRKYSLPEFYLATVVGTFSQRKNVETLILAHSLLRDRVARIPDLVIVSQEMHGDRGLTRERTASISVLPYVPEADLPGIIAGAQTLICPSLAEGFGMPVLEGLACGVPVVASDIPVFREIAGDCAVFVDPHDPGSICDGIIESLEISSSLDAMAKRIRRAQAFTWQNASGATMSVFRSVLQRGQS